MTSESQLLRVKLLVDLGPRQVHEADLLLPSPCTVRSALARADVASLLAPDVDLSGRVGIWGRRAAMTDPIHDLDRLEVYRALKVDPKIARRQRFQKQGARAAGLFSKRRPNAKPGY